MALPAGWDGLVANVPPAGTDGACELCHGVVPGDWPKCFKCGQIWSQQSGFDRIRLIVPCSVAVGGSPWYRAVYQYKAGSFDHYGNVLSEVLSTWLASNAARVSMALGRQPDVISVVPSKQSNHPTPLWHVVSAIPGLRDRLERSLRYRPGSTRPASREVVIADQFELLTDVTGKAVLIVEDTWVSGQTPISAALALANAGAEAVALVCIARMVYPDTLSADYLAATATPYNPAWPK